MANRTPPYMVALSGWPEPVYIAGPPLGSSRSGTPGLSGEYREGISSFDIDNHAREGISAGSSTRSSSKWPGPSGFPGHGGPVPPESIFSRTCMYNNDPSHECQIPDHPNHIAKYAQARPLPGNLTPSRAESPAFPTSSTRGTPHPSPPPSRRGSPKPASYPRHSSPLTLPMEETSLNGRDPRARSFADPRYAPHVAVMSNRPALPLAPSWGSAYVPRPDDATSPGDATPPVLLHPNSTGVGVRIPAGQRGTGILVMRAVPDVYPPPASMPGIAGMATEMTRTASGSRKRVRVGQSPGLEVATEVYPRDPDSAILWGSGVPSRKTSMTSMSTRRVSEVRTNAGDDTMEVDER